MTEIEYDEFEVSDALLEVNPRLAHALANYDPRYDEIKRREKELEKLKKSFEAECRGPILDEIHHLNQASRGVEVRCSKFLDRPLKMAWIPTAKLDGERLRAERPELHAYYLNKSGHWRLQRG